MVVPRLDFVPFQFPTLVETPPDGDDWIHEVKYDGYRTQLLVRGTASLAVTRNGLDWSTKYRHIVDQAAYLSCRTAILDGEVIVPTEAGASDFHALRSAVSKAPDKLVFVAFDLLHLNGRDMRPMPCIERRAALEKLIAPADGRIQFSPHVDSSGKAFYAAVDALGLEGMVSKRASAAYVSGTSRGWLKTKCYEETDYEIAGVMRERGKPAMALMVDSNRAYVGAAFITWPREARERLWKRVQDKAGPLPKGMKPNAGAEWIKPGLVGRVKHLKGEEGKLRHATLKDVREE